MPLLSLTTLNTVELEKIYNKKKQKNKQHQTTSNIKQKNIKQK